MLCSLYLSTECVVAIYEAVKVSSAHEDFDLDFVREKLFNFLRITHAKPQMPDAIPSVLVPYVQDCLASARLTFLGSTLSTPANWLVIRFVYAAIQAKQNPSSAPYPGKQHNATSKAVLVSLLRPTDLWVELGKKIVGFSLLN